jgi:hypothetical protein
VRLGIAAPPPRPPAAAAAAEICRSKFATVLTPENNTVLQHQREGRCPPERRRRENFRETPPATYAPYCCRDTNHHHTSAALGAGGQAGERIGMGLPCSRGMGVGRRWGGRRAGRREEDEGREKLTSTGRRHRLSQEPRKEMTSRRGCDMKR